MSDRTKCIITGCTLRLAGSRYVVAGDLFLLDGVVVPGDIGYSASTFIFNGNFVCDDNGTIPETQWIDQDANIYKRELIIPHGYEYWERRGVFVMRASLRLLNDAARAYVAGEGVPG